MEIDAEMENVILEKPVVIAVKTVDYVKPTAEIELAIPGKTVNLVLMIVVYVQL